MAAVLLPSGQARVAAGRPPLPSSSPFAPRRVPAAAAEPAMRGCPPVAAAAWEASSSSSSATSSVGKAFASSPSTRRDAAFREQTTSRAATLSSLSSLFVQPPSVGSLSASSQLHLSSLQDAYFAAMARRTSSDSSSPRTAPIPRPAIHCSQYKGKFPLNPPASSASPPAQFAAPSAGASKPTESLFTILSNTHTLLPLTLAVAVPLISGAIVGLAANPMQEWYGELQRPWFQPPDWVFGAMWSLLYPVMGVASFLVWRDGGWAVQRGPLLLYAVQLVVNLAWPVVFFKMHRIGAALGVIALLLILAGLTLFSFAAVSPLAATLFLPYTLWVAYATALNFALWNRNKGNKPGRGGGGGGSGDSGGMPWGEGGGGGGGGWGGEPSGGDDGDGGEGVSVKAERVRWKSVVVSRALSFLLGQPGAAIAATNPDADASLSGKQQLREKQPWLRPRLRVIRPSEYKGYELGALNIAPVGSGKPGNRATNGTG